jgi:hypothetical protein
MIHHDSSTASCRTRVFDGSAIHPHICFQTRRAWFLYRAACPLTMNLHIKTQRPQSHRISKHPTMREISPSIIMKHSQIKFTYVSIEFSFLPGSLIHNLFGSKIQFSLSMSKSIKQLSFVFAAIPPLTRKT